MKTPKKYNCVAEMVRDLSEPAFSAEFDAHLRQRQVVKMLTALRNKAGLSQAELATKLGWSQSKVSKFETGMDADASFGDILAFAGAVGDEVTVVFAPRGQTLAERVKMHAGFIDQDLNQMVALAGSDPDIQKGVLSFLDEADDNLARIVALATYAMPVTNREAALPVRVRSPELEVACEDRTPRPPRGPLALPGPKS